MPRQSKETGTIDYTGRAFHQDAMEAMRGDIVRGIIELITNSDDAYAPLQLQKPGRILVQVEHRRNQTWRVIVRDRATGLRAADMKRKFSALGGRTSGFESGQDRRGNLGRGAKDLAAFGDVSFEAICDNRYSKFVLHQDGSWELDPEHDARTEEREELGSPRGNGLVVTTTVAAHIRCPHHDNLQRKLNTHFQLRDILSDPNRWAELENLNDAKRERLTYRYPDLPVVFSGHLNIEGYSEAKAELTIWRLPERSDDGPTDVSRPNGILIKGTRAIYENTLFSFEGNVHAGWFAGRLTCPYIDRLAREYDDRLVRGLQPDPNNPFPIISRRRDGLTPDHPFIRALRGAADAPLRDLVARETEKARAEAGNVESVSTRAALERLATEVGRLISEEMREIEAEELPGGQEGLPPLLQIVPEQVFAYMGEDRTLTVAARNENVSVGDEVHIDADPVGVVEILTPVVPLRSHTRREDLLVGQIRLRPLIEGEVTLVAATMADRTANALVEVRPGREEIEEVVEPPTTLQFERPSYQVSWQRKKALSILAPATFVAEQGIHVTVSSSDPGIAIRGTKVELVYDDSVEYYRTSVQIEARTLGATTVISARVGEAVAETHVAVVRREEGPNFKIQLVREDFGVWRAIVEREPIESGAEQSIIKIAGRHPALRRYLGENFERQDSPVCRGMIAEVVADVTARLVVSELYRLRRGTEAFDADRFYREHYKRLTRFLPRFQGLLVGDAAAASGPDQLAPLSILEVAPVEGATK